MMSSAASVHVAPAAAPASASSSSAAPAAAPAPAHSPSSPRAHIYQQVNKRAVAGSGSTHDALLDNPSGPYTVMRTVSHGTAVFRLTQHVERVATSVLATLDRLAPPPAAAASSAPPAFSSARTGAGGGGAAGGAAAAGVGPEAAGPEASAPVSAWGAVGSVPSHALLRALCEGRPLGSGRDPCGSGDNSGRNSLTPGVDGLSGEVSGSAEAKASSNGAEGGAKDLGMLKAFMLDHISHAVHAFRAKEAALAAAEAAAAEAATAALLSTQQQGPQQGMLKVQAIGSVDEVATHSPSSVHSYASALSLATGTSSAFASPSDPSSSAAPSPSPRAAAAAAASASGEFRILFLVAVNGGATGGSSSGHGAGSEAAGGGGASEARCPGADIVVHVSRLPPPPTAPVIAQVRKAHRNNAAVKGRHCQSRGGVSE